MTKKKNLPAKPQENKKNNIDTAELERNNLGIIIPDEMIEQIRSELRTEKMKQIFTNAHKYLKHINRDNLQNLPDLETYAVSQGIYFECTNALGTDYTIEGKTGPQINPLFNVAQKARLMAKDAAQRMGLDAWSASRVPAGEKPQAPETKKTDKDKIKEGFLG